MSLRRFKVLPIYAAMLYLGLLCALLVSDILARLTGLPPLRVLGAQLLLIPMALAGARALAVALSWGYFRERPREILRVEHGGAAMYGALPPMLLVSIPILRWLDLPFGAFWDLTAMAILVGMIPTRFGCLSTGCCRGRLVSSRWGELRLPNPLFEALLGAGLLMLLVALRPLSPFGGALFLVALAGYATGRFFLEWLRDERAMPFMGLSVFQWISAGLVVAGATGLAAGLSTSGAGAAATVALDLQTLDVGPAAARVLTAGLLLLPVMLLFRFLGCHLVFSLDRPRFEVRLNIAIPDVGGTGPFTATMTLERESSGEEIPESPVDLAAAGNLPDGRLVFETLIDIEQGDYRARGVVTRAGIIARTGQCSGSLNAPNLVVRFAAETNDPIDVLQPQLCFEEIS